MGHPVVLAGSTAGRSPGRQVGTAASLVEATGPPQHATFSTTTGNTGFDEALIVGWRP